MATPIPTNMATFTLDELVLATGAELRGAKDCLVRGVTTDSRINVAAKLFVALSGDRFDGHDYLNDAVAQGASAVMVDREPISDLPVPILRVASTIRALGDIARFHRNRWPGIVVAIAGSAGKTTTRVACQSLLETTHPGKVLGTFGNLNNQIGVPMTLLRLTDEHDYAVVEVGTNSPGEVKRLADVCRPNVAVLTLIGLEHAEGLGDIDDIECEEGDILEGLKVGAIAVGNGDDSRVIRQMTGRASNSRRVTYGTHRAVDYYVTQQLSPSLDRSTITIERSQAAHGGQLSLESRLLGTPGALAVTAALAVVESLGIAVDQDVAQTAFMREHLGEQGRLQCVMLDGGIIVLDDSYNANPPSMASSIAVATELARCQKARLVLVLGEMLELGALSEREHRLLGTKLDAASQLIAVGSQARALFDSARSAGVPSEFCADAEDAAQSVARLAQSGDVVLVKGSRGVRLERVVQTLVNLKGYAA